MLKTRDELIDYAMKICLPLMERTANRRISGEIPCCIDHVGYTVSFLENYCRPLWGIAPIIRDSDQEYFIRAEGRKVNICDWIREVLLDGIDPESPNSWIKYQDSIGLTSLANQAVTELAGLMLGMFIAREKLWDPIGWKDQKRIADWLYHLSVTAFENSWPNNHYWFPMLILLILKKLGFAYDKTDLILADGLEKLDRLYLGNGWYQDGDFGRFDYYQVWSLHTYPLIWAMIEDNSFEGYEERKAEYIRRTNQLLDYYAHLFDATGAHVPFGRSLSYRFAASALFPLAVYSGCEMDYGLAREITLKNIGYFQDCSVPDRDGILPPGFCYEAPGLVENYTCDAGAYWCTKAFLALLMGEDHPFWTAPTALLPIEQGDYLAETGNRRIHMPVEGGAGFGVTLYNNSAKCMKNGVMAHKFNDMGSYYGKFIYNSRSGFGLSTRDNVSLDNMIGLTTEDLTMCSHRMDFEDLGEKSGILSSSHIPFSNDPASRIKTWLIPLGGGLHIKIHRVRLSGPYYIIEGGFSVGMQDDYKNVQTEKNYISISTKSLISAIYTVATVPVAHSVRIIQPGMHLLAPAAVYPSYRTEQVCQKGEYIFASVFYLSSDVENQPAGLPDMQIAGDTVEFTYKGRKMAVDTTA